MGVSAMDCRGGGRDGTVCHSLAAGHQANAHLYSLYVQRDKSDIRIAVCVFAVW